MDNAQLLLRFRECGFDGGRETAEIVATGYQYILNVAIAQLIAHRSPEARALVVS